MALSTPHSTHPPVCHRYICVVLKAIISFAICENCTAAAVHIQYVLIDENRDHFCYHHKFVTLIPHQLITSRAGWLVGWQMNAILTRKQKYDMLRLM